MAEDRAAALHALAGCEKRQTTASLGSLPSARARGTIREQGNGNDKIKISRSDVFSTRDVSS
jgi:hypothetical protein